MSALDLVSSDTRRELLQLVKRRGSLSLDEAMDALGMARTTVREHLLRLERKGLVARSTERSGRGRPSLRYRMTPKAKILFPSRDGELMGRVLEFLDQEGAQELVARFFETYWQERTDRIRAELAAAGDDDLETRLELLAAILAEEGFMPNIERSGDGITVRECNCPFPESVKQTRLPCQLEAAFYEAIFGAAVERSHYIPDGHPACTYELDPEADTPS